MSGRAAIEETLKAEGQTKLRYLKYGLVLGFAYSLTLMGFASFGAAFITKTPNYWAVNIVTFFLTCLACVGWAFIKRELLIREAVQHLDVEMERRRAQAEQDKLAMQRALAAEAQAAQERLQALAERQRIQREWGRTEANRRTAEELAALENKVQVLWADFQATHNFTGEIPADVMRERFNAELRKHFSTTDLSRLGNTQNQHVIRLITGRGQA